ncbi:hypothetical protein BUY99_05190 [Staphylococcus gallinarum]|uniref:hypothetical protein n=1 Tax=Staphylococcus gallinarum TaxID=1293 RepID=UPI000E67CC34|nr:hypothetical protein [Staphylococcus gallinarum]RIL23385.1 hypothetical protein BUY99_05190 [Staphylococcus gallinarum]
MKKQKLDIELDKTDFSLWKHLSKTDIQYLEYGRNHLNKINNMLPILSVLLLFTNLMYNFKYSEYIFLIVSVIVITASIYIIISTISTKRKIKSIMYPISKSDEKANGIKIRMYNYKMFDVMDSIVRYLICIWGFLNLVGSILRIV